METIPTDFEIFLGNSISFPKYKLMLLQFLRNSSKVSPFGLLEEISPDQAAEKQRFYFNLGITAADVPAKPADPGAFPEEDGIVFQQWKWASKLKSTWDFDTRTALQVILTKTMSPAVRNVLGTPDAGFVNIDLKELFNRLQNSYGTLRVHDLITVKAPLSDIFVAGACMRTFVERHLHIHHILASSGQAMTEFDKLQMFCAALGPCGIFKARIDRWFAEEVPDVDAQVFSSMVGDPELGLSNVIISYSISLPTSGSSFAFATTTPAASDSTRKQPVKCNCSAHYCWTHGPNTSHESAACTRQKAGHQVDATFASMKGGKTMPWAKPPGKKHN
jgi:hypothetical protein